MTEVIVACICGRKHIRNLPTLTYRCRDCSFATWDEEFARRHQFCNHEVQTIHHRIIEEPPVVRPRKELDDAELAAEYHQQYNYYDMCTEGYSSANDGYRYDTEKVEEKRVTILRRFAITPGSWKESYA